jgi:very-short-patch-repair endonuclease
VTFAPLPVFVRGGNSTKRIEPDFIIVKGGMVALIEVDGPIHRESPLEAQERIAMLVQEGAHVERVRASDCGTMEGAEVCAKRVLASLAKVRASR